MIPATAAALAAALVTFLHLRSANRHRASPFPSLELLPGASAPRRPSTPVEEPMRYATRLAAILFLAAALLLSRRGRSLGPEVDLVDGSRSVNRDALELRFEGENPRVEAPERFSAEREIARRSLESCSASHADCLLRAGRRVSVRPRLVSDFSDGAFREALRRDPGPFDFVRLPPRSGPPPPPDRERDPLSHPEVSAGPDDFARLWEAALRSVSLAGAERLHILVAESEPAALDSARKGRAVFLPIAGPLSATEAHPLASKAAFAGGIRSVSDEALVADIAGIGGPFSFRFASDPRFDDLAGGVAVRRRFGAGAIVSAAVSREELGRIAHSTDLSRLARLVVAALLPQPALLSQAPAGGRPDWIRESGSTRAAVGLIDTSPGTYRRSDGKLRLDLRRNRVEDRLPLSDAELASLGGRPLAGNRASPGDLPVALLLALAIIARLLDAPREARGRGPAILLFAGGIALLAAFLFDLRLPATKSVRPILRFDPSSRAGSGDGAAKLQGLLRNSSVRVDSGNRGGGRCESAASASPCEVVAVVGSAASRLSNADALYFSNEAPRVDILSVELPEETAPAERGECRATVAIRQGRGRRLRLEVRASDGPAGVSETPVEQDDQVIAISAPLASIGEGVRFASVSASLSAPGSTDDARAVAWIVRPRSERMLLASGTPGWDSRFLAEGLETPRRHVEMVTRLGKTALLAREASLEDPISLLSRNGSLDGFSLVVLSGFEKGDLTPSAARNLESFVAAGGGLLLTRPELLPSLSPATTRGGSEPAGTRPLRAEAFGRAWSFDGYPPSPAELAAGSTVLARAAEPDRERVPWIVGRGFGKGRVAAVLAPDLWRAAAPGSESSPEGGFLAAGLAEWLTASRPARARASVSEDLVTLRVESPGVATQTLTLPSPGPIDGLPVDSSDPLRLLPEGRPRLRVEALRHGRRLIEADSLSELAEFWRRFPPFAPLSFPAPIRDDDRIVSAAFALLAMEVFLRRRRRCSSSALPEAP